MLYVVCIAFQIAIILIFVVLFVSLLLRVCVYVPIRLTEEAKVSLKIINWSFNIILMAIVLRCVTKITMNQEQAIIEECNIL